MLKRASRQSITDFVLYGSESLKTKEGNFDERLRECERNISDCLKEFELSNKQMDELTFHEGLLIDLYFEEGVKIGALLSQGLIGG